MTRLVRLAGDLRLPLFRNAYALLLSSLLTSGLGIVYWAVAANVYPTTDVGIGASLVSVLMFITSISTLNLQSVLYRFLPRAGGNARSLVIGTYAFVIASGFLFGTIIAVGGAAIGALPEAFSSPDPTVLAIFVGSVVIWNVFAFQDHVLASMRLSVWIPVENAIFAILKLVLLVLFVGLHPFGIFVSWVISAALGVSVVSGTIFGFLLPRYRAQPQTEAFTTRGVVRYVAADYAAGAFATSASSLMPVLVLILLGPAQSAYFYPVWLIGQMLRLAPVAMYSSLLVESSSGHAEYEHDGRRVLLLVGLTLGLPVLALVAAAPLALVVFGAEYAEAGALPMRLLALTAIPFALNSFAAYLARSQARMRTVVVIEAAVAIPSLALALALALPLGLTGVALAILAAQTLVAVVVSARVLRPVFRNWSGHR